MKRTLKTILISLLIGLCFSNIASAADPSILFSQGNMLFLKGDYKNAAASYEEILNTNKMMSPELYFNLGNCFFKLTDYPNAILNYERALKLKPGDEDVLINLRMSSQKIEDRIEPVPELFYIRWSKALRNQMQAGSWAALSLIFLGLSAGGCFLFVLSSKVSYRKTGFYGVLTFLLLSLGTFGLAWSRYRATYVRNEAIIFSGSVSVKSAPTENSTGLFLLHSGSKVKINDELEGWVKIKTYDGNEGWILRNDLEVI